ncbi:MAG: trypsin-like peptidase domain-containing protein [Candidatus Wildermuthbacteria bacterium]|nr:trypsin-like peptidase domain-containing protein [Candidatus Wildermuthbacteria bacterium]
MDTFSKTKSSFSKFLRTVRRKEMAWLLPAVVCVSVVSGLAGGVVFEYLKGNLVSITPAENIGQEGGAAEYVPQTTQEQKIIDAVKVVSPSVVSIIITKDVPIIEQYFSNPFEEFFGQGSPFRLQVPQYRQKGTEKKEVGGGSGFIVSADGYVVTNKHVVLDEEADYTVFTNDGKSYPAKVLAKDPLQDLAILKIEEEQIVNESGAFTTKPFVPVRLGDASTLQIGQSVIAIGNALGEFRNTVSVGVISGLGRTITASGGANFVETIEDVIQTDAAINKGNSGGPLLNLAGEVIGINTATVLDAQNIGFAVPINKVKRDIEQVRAVGKITYPLLGVRYVLITQALAKDRNLPVTYGALIEKGDSATPAVTIGSAADKAGMREGDIILEFNGERVSPDNSLAKLIQKYNPKDTVVVKILRGEEEKILQVTLGERSE